MSKPFFQDALQNWRGQRGEEDDAIKMFNYAFVHDYRTPYVLLTNKIQI